jgi:hypothetical protein
MMWSSLHPFVVRGDFPVEAEPGLHATYLPSRRSRYGPEQEPRAAPPDGNGFLALPRLEDNVTAIDERRGPAAGTLLLSPHEQMDGNVPFKVILDIPTIGAIASRPVLTLPFELRAIEKAVVILELLGMARLVQRHEQKDVPGPLDEAGIPGRRRELEAEEWRNLLARVALPELQFTPAPPERAQVPFGPLQLQ